MAVCGDNVSSLSGETLEKARRELNEDPATRMEVISQLREKIASWEAEPEEEGVQFSRRDDRFLLCFLRARKFDVERALQLYVNYHLHRERNAGLLGDFQPHSSEGVLRGGIISVLEARSRDGSRVLMLNGGRWDMEATPIEEPLRALLLVLDRLVEEEETQVPRWGVVPWWCPGAWCRGTLVPWRRGGVHGVHTASNRAPIVRA